MRYVYRIPCVLAFSLLFAVPDAAVQAQPLALDRMPASVVNTPEADLFGLRRPALSLVGFDNTEEGYTAGHGLGLRQVLEARYNRQDPLVVPVFDRVIELARRELVDPYASEGAEAQREQLTRNTQTVQARAFEALATFVLVLNGTTDGDLQALGLRPHPEAMAALTDALTQPPGGTFIFDQALIDDPVKYSRPVSNVARALDLYLALENAYVQFAGEADLGLLLSPDEREAVWGEYAEALLTVDGLLGLRAVDVYAEEIDLPDVVKDLLLPIFDLLPAGDRVVEEVEPGNWALKQRVAAGYGALAMQAPPGSPEAGLLTDLYAKALRSLSVVGGENESRLRHWNFMTRGGEPFWAEGPYYLDYALEQALPFWHAVRANGLPGADDDPFRSSWLLDPLRWHADLVTPNGRIAPLDDGNKAPIRYPGLMRWDAAYGDAEVGRRYAWIDAQVGGPGHRDEVLLVELAVPRTATEQPPPDRVADADAPDILEPSEQQLVVRQPGGAAGETHYVLLNGEHGAAVARGEGHEQPDQLQLLYYRGPASYLMDSGYDRGFTVENSTWNHYYDHNVLTVGPGEGGLLPPELNLFDVRKASEPWLLGEVEALSLETRGAVTVLSGTQPLTTGPGREHTVDYGRDVLVVGDEAPYLIDLNRAEHRLDPGDCESNRFRMLYHPGSDAVDVPGPPASYRPHADGFLRWSGIGGDAGRTLDVFPMAVEAELEGVGEGAHLRLEDDTVTEAEFEGKKLRTIRKLTIQNPDRCEPFWSVATLLRTDGGPEGDAPALLWPYADAMERQGWVWPLASGAYDVFVARSVRGTDAPITFRPSDADAAFPPVELRLAEGVAYGFARLEEAGGTWQVAAGYAVHLEPTGTTTAVEGGAIPEAYALEAPYPNPSRATSRLALRLREPQEVTVTVYDALGRRAAVLHRGLLGAGQEHTLTLDGAGWASGVYLVRVEGEAFTATRRWTLLR